MGFFDKAEFAELSTVEEKIKGLFIYLGNLESKKIQLLNKIKSAQDSNSKEKLEEQFKELCQHAEEIEKHLIQLNREERRAAVTDIGRLKKINKMRERAVNLKSKQKIPKKPTQQKFPQRRAA